MKHKIMEVLLSGDNNLTKEEINWAIANIPNDTVNQSRISVYDHSRDSIWDACGFNDDKLEELSQEYKKLRTDSPDGKKSNFIEYFMNNASPDLLNLFIIKGIQYHQQQAHDKMLEELKSLIDKLGK